jgi:hypothetical protein
MEWVNSVIRKKVDPVTTGFFNLIILNTGSGDHAMQNERANVEQKQICTL